MRFIRKLLTYLVVIALIVVGAGVGVFYLTPSSTITGLVTSQVKDATGRDLVIEGDLERTLFPVLGFRSGRFEMANAEWAKEEGAFAEAKSASFGLKFLPLLTGRFDIEEIRLEEPKLRLVVAEDGATANWIFEEAKTVDDVKKEQREKSEQVGEDPAEGARDALRRMSLKVAEVTDAELIFINRNTGQRTTLTDGDLTISLPSYEATLTIKGAAMVNGRQATVDGAFDSPAKIGSGEVAATDFSLTAEGVAITYNGRIKAPVARDDTPEINGEFSLQLDGDPKKTAWLKAMAPQLEPLGAANLTGSLRIEPKALDVAVKGAATFNRRETQLSATAKADEGWIKGDKPIAVDASVRNPLVNAAFKGDVTKGAAAIPLATGAYVLQAPDVPGLLDWSGAGAAASRLEAVDVAGRIDVGKTTAKGDMKGEIRYGGRQVAISGDVDGGAGWTLGQPIGTRFEAQSPRFFLVSWDGSVPTDPKDRSVQGKLTAETDALREVVEWLSGERVPGGPNAFKLFRLVASVSATADTAEATIDAFQLDQSSATGALKATGLQARPNFDVTLNSGPLDLRAFETLGGGQKSGRSGGRSSRGGAGGGGQSGGWSDAPIDYAPLKLADGTFDIQVGGLRTSSFALGESHVSGALKDGVLDVDVKRIGLYGGEARGALKIDAASDPAIGADLTADGVQLRPVLRDFAQVDRLEGTGSMKLNVASPARSMKQLMTSIDGGGSIDLRDGAILGIDIPGTLRRLANPLNGGGAQSEKTDFASITASFAIKDGVASNEDLLFLGPLLRMTGAGTVNLGAQSMNYTAKPKLVASLQGQGGSADASGITIPVLISGPWSNLSYAPDLSGVVGNALKNPGELLKGLTGGGSESGGGGSSGGGLLDQVAPQSGGGGGGGGGGASTPKTPDVGKKLKGLFGN